ncbi:MAG: RNA polymerase sigma factor [Lachnospiraceae bacterium]|nr:RNA polymerase sigma factor [Lachnospiraceae bacterium]
MTTTEIRERFEREAIRLRPILLRVAASITGSADEADDIAQETLLKLWFLRDRLEEYANIDAPARVIARNLSLNVIRNRKPTVAMDDCELRNIADDDSSQESMPEELTLAISKLPGTEQAVLRMKHLDGMETEEIAALIGATPGAVRSALSRGRERIRKLYLVRH